MPHNAIEVTHKFIRQVRPTLFDSGLGARLPSEYKKFYDEWKFGTPEPVHYIKREGTKWKMDEKTGRVRWHEEVPIPGKIPQELNCVFTGGEMVVQGFLPPKPKLKKFAPKVAKPRFWMPNVYKSVIYSEILNKHMSVLLTKRVIDLIHRHQGLDNYLLQTKACDLKTLIAVQLKRKLLLSLRDKELPYDEEKNLKIYKKYEPFLLSPEEIEWYGLSFSQACRKLKELEEKQKEDSTIPLKHIFRAQLIEELKAGSSPTVKDEGGVEEKKSWYSAFSNLGISKKNT